MVRYDSYKDSGVEWVGEIPSKWEWLKIKNLFSFSKGTGISKSDIEEDGTSKCILYGELFTRFKDFNVIPSEFSKTNLEDRIVSEGNELLIPGSTTTTSVDLCNCKTLNHKGIQLGGDIIILKPRRNDIFNEFYSYYISTVTKPDFETGGRGVTIHHIYPKQIREIHIPYIPLSEQQQIVSFLDTKTSLIDSLIEKTQRKIELLKERRTSLINEVVTKGLNPNVEVKDSGVEWIGEIPSHWEFVRIGHLNRVVRGGSPRPSGDPRFFNGDFIHWITVKDITSKTGKYVTTTDTKLTEEGMKQSRVLEPETLVLTNSGVTLGIPGILKIRGCINDGSVSFLDMSPKIERDYLYYFWTTQTELLLEQQSGYGQPNLNIEIVSNVRFPLPPLSEQQQIVEYLDEQTGLIDKTISIEEKRIELLKEYRQSLISEVVTGKRKVV